MQAMVQTTAEPILQMQGVVQQNWFHLQQCTDQGTAGLV
jgi:hypothetical protein